MYGAPREDGRLHARIDLCAPIGTEIIAPADGRVSQIAGDPQGRGGFFLRIDHGNGWETLYLHIHAIFGQHPAIIVRPEQQVLQGQLLGYVGDTHYLDISDRPHLHLEIIGPNKDGVRMNWDPMNALFGIEFD